MSLLRFDEKPRSRFPRDVRAQGVDISREIGKIVTDLLTLQGCGHFKEWIASLLSSPEQRERELRTYMGLPSELKDSKILLRAMGLEPVGRAIVFGLANKCFRIFRRVNDAIAGAEGLHAMGISKGAQDLESMTKQHVLRAFPESNLRVIEEALKENRLADYSEVHADPAESTVLSAIEPNLRRPNTLLVLRAPSSYDSDNLEIVKRLVQEKLVPFVEKFVENRANCEDITNVWWSLSVIAEVFPEWPNLARSIHSTIAKGFDPPAAEVVELSMMSEVLTPDRAEDFALINAVRIYESLLLANKLEDSVRKDLHSMIMSSTGKTVRQNCPPHLYLLATRYQALSGINRFYHLASLGQLTSRRPIDLSGYYPVPGYVCADKQTCQEIVGAYNDIKSFLADTSSQSQRPAILIVGRPGVGKTILAKKIQDSYAQSAVRLEVRLQGTETDSANLLQELKRSKPNVPVLVRVDEVDKSNSAELFNMLSGCIEKGMFVHPDEKIDLSKSVWLFTATEAGVEAFKTNWLTLNEKVKGVKDWWSRITRKIEIDFDEDIDFQKALIALDEIHEQCRKKGKSGVAKVSLRLLHSAVVHPMDGREIGVLVDNSDYGDCYRLEDEGTPTNTVELQI
ncbi:MAG: AAA family ATPase [Candidatus Bathyarchaeia archaeon]